MPIYAAWAGESGGKSLLEARRERLVRGGEKWRCSGGGGGEGTPRTRPGEAARQAATRSLRAEAARRRLVATRSLPGEAARQAATRSLRAEAARRELVVTRSLPGEAAR